MQPIVKHADDEQPTHRIKHPKYKARQSTYRVIDHQQTKIAIFCNSK